MRASPPSRSSGPRATGWPPWLLPAFFAAHVVVTAVLIPLLRVRDPLYQSIPWIFGAAFALSLLPPVRGRLAGGSLGWRLAPLLLYATVISLASSVNPRATTGFSSNVFHPVEYAGLALLAHLALHRGAREPLRPSRLGLVVLGCMLFGGLDELHQSFVPRRSSTLEDVALDTVGALAGTVIFVAGVWLSRRLAPTEKPR